MIRRSTGRVAAALALTMLLPACRDASTAPLSSDEEIVVVSLAGISADAAGIVLRVSGSVEHIEAAYPSLDVAWAVDDPTSATVAVLGRIADFNEVLIVRTRASAAALTVQVIDVTDGDGILSLPATARVVVTTGST